MKYLLIFTLLMGSLQIHAQTKPIAYKSHAGDMDFFLPEHQPEDDFGNPPPRIIRFVKINDSTVVEMLDDWGYGILDTVVNHPHFKDPTLSLDQIKKKYNYPNDIEFIGFDKKTAPVEKVDSINTKKVKNSNKVMPFDNKKACPAKEDKKVKKKAHKKRDAKRAEITVIPTESNNTPPNNGNYLPWVAAAAIGYLSMLGLLVWKRQREKLLKNA